jgi:hypothetical protein
MSKISNNIENEVLKTLESFTAVEYSRSMDGFYSSVEERLEKGTVKKRVKFSKFALNLTLAAVIILLNIFLVYTLIESSNSDIKLTGTQVSNTDNYSIIANDYMIIHNQDYPLDKTNSK